MDGSQSIASSSGASLVGTRVYSPGAIAVYSLLGGLPLGCLLHGLNIARRGAKGMGTTLYLLAGASYLFMLVATTMGASVAPYGLLGIFGAIGFYKIEGGPFESALRRGAKRAKWWPPALIALGATVVLAVAVAVSGAQQVGP